MTTKHSHKATNIQYCGKTDSVIISCDCGHSEGYAVWYSHVPKGWDPKGWDSIITSINAFLDYWLTTTSAGAPSPPSDTERRAERFLADGLAAIDPRPKKDHGRAKKSHEVRKPQKDAPQSLERMRALLLAAVENSEYADLLKTPEDRKRFAKLQAITSKTGLSP